MKFNKIFTFGGVRLLGACEAQVWDLQTVA